ncbi:MAG: nucleoside triphosphate pyrophosphohydrolase [Bacteroidales bacterium]|nr:nucleoside triphosphate pyrophosphohydrolase [Bacteroidales bacterium]
MHDKSDKVAAFERLLDVMDALREKCPWNAEQTMESIRPLTEEEVYELSDAILKADSPAVCKEIGDLLYHMVFYARIAQEQGLFDIADSLNKVCDKMVFRHPHVFGPDAGKPTTAKEIADTWELVKAKEKGGNKTVMGGIPDSMPALLKAMSMQEKARGCGFDWEKPEDVWPKVLEELSEAREACSADCSVDFGSAAQEEVRKTGFEKPSTGRFSKSIPPAALSLAGPSHSHCVGADGFSVPLPDSAAPKSTEEKKTEEFGDLLFAVINAARLYGVDPEAALNGACSKFRRRFNYVEAGILGQGRTLADATIADMDSLWDEAKQKGL